MNRFALLACYGGDNVNQQPTPALRPRLLRPTVLEVYVRWVCNGMVTSHGVALTPASVLDPELLALVFRFQFPLSLYFPFLSVIAQKSPLGRFEYFFHSFASSMGREQTCQAGGQSCRAFLSCFFSLLPSPTPPTSSSFSSPARPCCTTRNQTWPGTCRSRSRHPPRSRRT